MLYRFFRGFFRLLFTLLFRWEVKGTEYIPQEGPVVICCNHISNFDPPLLGSSIQRPIRFMAKEELFKVPILSFFIRSFGAFSVSRGGQDKRALKTALALLKNGEVLGIYPEGTRSKTGELGKAHSGAAFIALRGKAVVIPAAIVGPYRLFRPLRIVFGPPVDLQMYQGSKWNSEMMQEVTDKIMDRIQAILEKNRS